MVVVAIAVVVIMAIMAVVAAVVAVVVFAVVTVNSNGLVVAAAAVVTHCPVPPPAHLLPSSSLNTPYPPWTRTRPSATCVQRE